MDKNFIDILLKLVEDHGTAPLLDITKSKAFLKDLAKEFEIERELLLRAIEARVSNEIYKSEELEICKKIQIRELHEKKRTILSDAEDIVNVLALVLRNDTNITESEETIKARESAKAVAEVAAKEEARKKEAEDAARRAAAEEFKRKQTVFKQKCSKSYGICITKDGKQCVNNVILKGSDLPVHWEDGFGTSVANQTRLNIRVFENNSTNEYVDLNECTEMFETCSIELPPGLAENSPFNLIFEVNENGEFDISAYDLTNRMPLTVRFKRFSSDDTSTAGKTYKVGDIGPAGGIIFYDKGKFSDGWQYLEAAPAVTEWSDIKWGAYKQDVAGTSEAVGEGKRNTKLIVKYWNGKYETSCAAQLCASLNFNGFKDWFLPSFDELNLMYENLKKRRLGGFCNDVYWSSSQLSNTNSRIVNFDNGYRSTNSKDYSYRVRAVRAF